MILIHNKTGAVGMVHVALPDSSIDRSNKAKTKPGFFADTGIPALLNCMNSIGCSGPVSNGNFTVKMAGGASVLACNDMFKIGKRNAYTLKGVLEKYGLKINAAHVGGNFSRTVSVEAGTGKIILTSPGRGEWTL